MNKQEINQIIYITLKKFYVIDYLVNYFIDLDTANRYINEPYINPILEELYNLYLNYEYADKDIIMQPYIDELIEKMEKADNDYMRITTYDYKFLQKIYKILKEDRDINIAYSICEDTLTVWQYEAIIKHHNKFEE